MGMFYSYLGREAERMREEGVRLRVIGRRDRFSPRLVKAIERAEALTAGGSEGDLVIAADYGGHWDIANAARQLAEQVEKGELAAAAEGGDKRILVEHLREHEFRRMAGPGRSEADE